MDNMFFKQRSAKGNQKAIALGARSISATINHYSNEPCANVLTHLIYTDTPAPMVYDSGEWQKNVFPRGPEAGSWKVLGLTKLVIYFTWGAS